MNATLSDTIAPLLKWLDDHQVPEKDYNAMKGKMESTSLPEWQKYYADLKAFKERMKERMPDVEDSKAFSEWRMSLSMDTPNKPGYYRANND